MTWHHEPTQTMRYRVLDAAEGGLRILSSVPLLQGMIGVAVRLLPEGQPLNQTVMVAWVQRTESSRYDVGLRFVQACR